MSPRQHTEPKPVKTAPVGPASKQAQPGCGRKGGHQPVGDQLPTSQALLQTVIDALPEYIIVVDRDFRIVVANRAARQAAVACDSEALTCHRLVHDSDTPCHTSGVCCPVEQVIRTGKRATATHLHHDAQGTEIAAEVTATPILDSNGQVIRVVVSSRDITQRKRADLRRAELEAQLRQARKTQVVGRLAGRIAHDFNNILTALLGNVELMTAELEAAHSPNDTLLASLAQIDRTGQRAAALTKQLLALSRHEAARPQTLDPNQVIAELEELLRSLLDVQVVLELSLEPGLAGIYADPVQIEQIVMSLVLNARDAMPTGGKLTLKTANVILDESYVNAHPGARVGPHVMIAVSDTGDGMDEETRRRVIEPFFAAGPREHESALGLAPVCAVLRQAQGYITVDSEVGRGTTFKVYWPVAVHPDEESS